MDLCDLDEAGFSMTLSNAYSWGPVGRRVRVPYEAPQGRRVNAVGALFYKAGNRTGRQTQRFTFATLARAPQPKRKAVSPLAAGLEATELGVLNAEFLIGFIWRTAGRPEDAAQDWQDWQRDKPLVIILDNYSVHRSARFQEERPKWRAANIDLFFLPSYSPELSGIEPLWCDVKQHRMRCLSRSCLMDLKRDVDAALTAKAGALASSAISLTESA
jgi:DDE superfamily endonuclease